MTAQVEERRLVAEPIMAWKIASLIDLPGGRIGFRPLSASGTYGTVEVAECRPVPGVTPGTWEAFWGRRWERPVPTHDAPHRDCACGFYARRDRPDPSRGTVTLRVALTGTVIVHERGYRAQRQQVTAVEIPKSCRGCPSTDVIGLEPHTYLPTCADCADEKFPPVTLVDLANDLCVDVSWCDHGTGSIFHSWRLPTTAVYLGVSAQQFAQSFQQAMQVMAQSALISAQQMQSVLDDEPDEPVHPLEAKRRRDEERRQRLEQLAGPRRAPRNLGTKGPR